MEFAKLRASRPFAPYMPTRLRALRAFVPLHLTYALYLPCTPFSRAFCALFVHL